jgi:hypothetical protein
MRFAPNIAHSNSFPVPQMKHVIGLLYLSSVVLARQKRTDPIGIATILLVLVCLAVAIKEWPPIHGNPPRPRSIRRSI